MLSAIGMTRVKIEQGELEGAQCETYVAFKGIPYAKPPLGELRFMAPEPPDAWLGVRDATKHGPVCPQYNEREGQIEEGSEDCLYINVFTKTANSARLRPVMVWIHGGAFYTGSGDSDFYGPDFLVADDVVLVTFNYRLEVLGFLCLDNDQVPGNAGLKDQVSAMRWVQKNIRAFGGDPDNVTIFGCSAGSAAVSYHMISPLSAGLFHRAICQSGVCLNDWSYGLYGRERAFQLGRQLGVETEDEKVLLSFLRNAPVMSLVHITLPKTSIDPSDSILFGPVIEKNFHSTPFICEPPIDILRRGAFAKVPLVIGYTNAEGIEVARYLPHMGGKRNMLKELNVPRELKLIWDKEKTETVADSIRKFYFEDKPITAAQMQNLVNLETDLHFFYNIVRFASHVSRSCPVYLYRLSCETERNYLKSFYNMSAVGGVCHGDDLPYIFNISKLKHTINSDTKSIIKGIVKLWTNFANTGNPSPPGEAVTVWEPFQESKRSFLIIDEVLQPGINPNHDRFLFWNKIYEDTF